MNINNVRPRFWILPIGVAALGLLAVGLLYSPSSPAGPKSTSCNGTYNGASVSDLTVSAGQSCNFLNGRVTGNVQQSGGNLTLVQSQVDGNVQVNGGGTFTIGPGSTINGNLQIQNLPSSSGQNQVCGTAVGGNVQFHNNGTAVLIGSTTPESCAGNTVGGNLEVHNNSATTIVAGNTIKGNVDDHNNAGPTQVFYNVVGKSLTCRQNSLITGDGNTAKSAQGQCVALVLPPDPGEAGKATVGGIDSNGNGVRDDVEHWIAITFNDGQQYVAVMQAARAIQRAMVSGNQQEAQEGGEAIDRSLRCLNVRFGGALPARDAYANLLGEMSNTEQRFVADEVFRSRVRPALFPKTYPNNGCDN